MGFLKRLSGSPPALLACLVAGGLVGYFFPGPGAWAAVLGQLYLGVIGMAALPLLVVATFFGLRQTLSLPQPGARMLMIASFAAALVAACAAMGVAFGTLADPGRGLDPATRAYLGRMVQQAGAQAGDSEMALIAPEQAPPAPEHPLSDLVPDNFFKALAEGQSLGILLCALLFGVAFAALDRGRSSALSSTFEAIYRALEIIISRVNLFIPVLVFCMAAYFVGRTEAGTVWAMGSFLGWFLLLAFGLTFAAAAIIGRQCGASAWQVSVALRSPALIALTSASTTASIPDTIDAMSNRLGFSRGVVELVTPVASVFLRGGSALYFALATVFVANLYGRALGPHELLLVGAGSFLAAFASAGNNSAANVGYAGMVLAMLQLPAEAVLALFLAIDLLCEGPRNLLTLMVACVLTALVSRGLPSERRLPAEGAAAPAAPIRFVFTRSDLVVGAVCSLVVAALLVLLGVGVGMKRGPLGPPAILGHSAVPTETRVG
jgi:aerobic C4-dicarboxylate transport protein